MHRQGDGTHAIVVKTLWRHVLHAGPRERILECFQFRDNRTLRKSHAPLLDRHRQSLHQLLFRRR